MTSRRAGATLAFAGAAAAPVSQLTIGVGLQAHRPPLKRRPKRVTRIRLEDVAAEAFAAGTLRLLAVDQGSTDCGLAMFVGGRVEWTKRLAPPDAWPWRKRMRWITDHLRLLLAAGAEPHIVAIEDVAFGVNAATAITMGEARGWLLCAFDHWYPAVASVAIHPATVRAAVEAPRSRAGAKERTRHVAERLTGLRDLSEDECDAVAIGIAARARIDRDARLAAAGVA